MRRGGRPIGLAVGCCIGVGALRAVDRRRSGQACAAGPARQYAGIRREPGHLGDSRATRGGSPAEAGGSGHPGRTGPTLDHGGAPATEVTKPRYGQAFGCSRRSHQLQTSPTLRWRSLSSSCAHTRTAWQAKLPMASVPAGMEARQRPSLGSRGSRASQFAPPEPEPYVVFALVLALVSRTARPRTVAHVSRSSLPGSVITSVTTIESALPFAILPDASSTAAAIARSVVASGTRFRTSSAPVQYSANGHRG